MKSMTRSENDPPGPYAPSFVHRGGGAALAADRVVRTTAIKQNNIQLRLGKPQNGTIEQSFIGKALERV